MDNRKRTLLMQNIHWIGLRDSLGGRYRPRAKNGKKVHYRQQKKNLSSDKFFLYGADYETRSARFYARRHAPDRRTVHRTVLCFATVFSSLDRYNLKIKNPHLTVRIFIFGADYETRTRYLHLGKVTLYRMS